MTLTEAVELILSEAHEGGRNLRATVRKGEDPGAERMDAIIAALDTIFDSLHGHSEMNRHLAAALFTLGSDVPLMISSWASKGHVWRNGLMEREVYRMLTGVQAIFEGRRLETDPSPETVH